MKYIWKLFLFLLLIATSLVFSSKLSKVYSQQAPPVSNSITVSVGVGDTVIVFSGKTSPESLVSFIENGVVIGSTSSGGGGNFTKTFTAQELGLRTIEIVSTDHKNRSSRAIKFNISVIPHAETKVSGIIIPPTIKISKSRAEYGEDIRVSGRTVPNSTVTLFFFENKTTRNAQADEYGNWLIKLDASDLKPGKYKIYAKTLTYGGGRSGVSNDKLFEIVDPNEITDKEAAQAEYPDLDPSLLECSILDYFVPFDTNSNCTLNYNEFLIAVQEWYHEWRDESNCDVNEDSTCDLVDFSIIMYYVER